jgi:hypothetical protein
MLRVSFLCRVPTASCALGVMLAFPLFSRSALAEWKPTPIGQVDARCIHEIAKGANYNTETGDVTMNGALLDHFDQCPVRSPDAPPVVGTSKGGTSFGQGWLAESTTNFESFGYNEYNYLEVEWFVPAQVTPQGSDTPVEYLFPGLQASNGSNTGAIIQPILMWGQAFGAGQTGGQLIGQKSWQMMAMESIDTNGTFNVGHSPSVTVNPGDTVLGVLYHIASLEWQVFIEDKTTGATSWNTVTFASTFPLFTDAVMGALEAYGNTSENIGIQNCKDLSSWNEDSFTLEVLYAGNSWNSYNEVTPNFFAGAFTGSPSCGYGASTSNGDASLTWTY